MHVNMTGACKNSKWTYKVSSHNEAKLRSSRRSVTDIAEKFSKYTLGQKRTRFDAAKRSELGGTTRGSFVRKRPV
jgi:hypothetical protein